MRYLLIAFALSGCAHVRSWSKNKMEVCGTRSMFSLVEEAEAHGCQSPVAMSGKTKSLGVSGSAVGTPTVGIASVGEDSEYCVTFRCAKPIGQ